MSGKLTKALKIAGWVAGGVIAAVGMVVGMSWHNARKIVRQADDKRRKRPEEHPGDYGMKFKTLDLVTDDDVHLHAWFVPGVNGGCVILQHGYKMHRAEMLPNARILNRHGFSLLMIELRNHGYSAGEKITFGYEEMKDIKAGLEYLKKRKDVDLEKIMMAGNSMGAAITIMATARFPEIRAAIADCPFADLTRQVSRGVRKFAPMAALAVPMSGLIRTFAERIAGFKTTEVSPQEVVGSIAPRPVMLIQGGADDVVGTHNGEDLYRAAGEPKELWEIPGCGHCEAVKLHPEEYERRVVPFCLKALGITEQK